MHQRQNRARNLECSSRRVTSGDFRASDRLDLQRFHHNRADNGLTTGDIERIAQRDDFPATVPAFDRAYRAAAAARKVQCV
jgi:hypothetical protein